MTAFQKMLKFRVWWENEWHHFTFCDIDSEDRTWNIDEPVYAWVGNGRYVDIINNPVEVIGD